MADEDLGLEPVQKAPPPPVAASPDADLGLEPVSKPTPEPDMTPVKNYIQGNLQQFAAAQAPKESSASTPAAPAAPIPQPREAHSILDAIEAGLKASTAGLFFERKMPDVVVPEHADWAMRMASQASTLAGDLPAMAVGFLGGAAAGSEIPFVGNVAGAAYGSFALPAALRTYYTQMIQQGSVKDGSDFMQRVGAIFLDQMKAGFTGIATEATGGLAAGAVGKLTSSAMLQSGASLSAQVAAMTTVGKAMEGHLPHPQDFLDGALLVAAFHGISSAAPKVTEGVTAKLQDIYAKTGLRPEQVVQEANVDPALKQDLLSMDDGIPEKYKPLVEETPKEPAPKEETAPPAAGGDNGEKLPPEEQAIRDRWAPSSEKETSPYTADDFKHRWVDNAHFLKVLTEDLNKDGSPLPLSKNPYELWSRAKNAQGMAENFINNGPTDFATFKSKGTEGLKDILKPHAKELDNLKDYIVAKGSLELGKRDIETGVPLTEAQKTVENGSAKFQKTYDKLVEFRNSSLAYLRDSGVIKPEAYDAMLKDNNRLAFFRQQEGGETTKSGNGPVKNPIKSIRGSDKPIIDPLESLVKETYQRIAIAEKNRALSALADLYDKNPESTQIEKLNTKMQAFEITPEEIQKHLDNNEIDGNVEDSLKIFRPKNQELQDNEIALFRDGKREVYKVRPELAETINGLQPQNKNLFQKVTKGFATLQRTGVVETPDFITRHLFRDQLNIGVLSRNGSLPYVTAFQGLRHMFGKTETYEAFLSSGAAAQNMVSIDRDYIQKNIFELSSKTELVGKMQNVIKNPLDLLRGPLDLMNRANRVGEFANATKGDFSPESLAKGARDARQITLDYQRMGAQVRAINQYVPFFNDRIQGLDLYKQRFQEDPYGTAIRMATYITIPSALIWWANRDDPEVQNVAHWQKDLAWVMRIPNWREADSGEDLTGRYTRDENGRTMVNDGPIIRLPKPFEPGLIFGSMIERTLDAHFKKDPNAFKDFDRSLMESTAPNLIPPIVAPILEKWGNHSLLSGAKIVPAHLEKALPEEQYTPYTSEAAKQLGKIITSLPGQRENSWAAPAVIQNTVRAWSGNLGMYALKIADQALYAAGVPDNRPEETWADNPFFKAFVVRNPNMGSQHITDFYENLDMSEKLMTTAKLKQERGDLQASMDFRQANIIYSGIQNTKKSLDTWHKMINAVNANPNNTKSDKRQLNDKLIRWSVDAAKNANNQVEELKKLVK